MPRPRKPKPDAPPALPARKMPRTRKQFEAEQSTAITPSRPAWEYRTMQSSDGLSPWFDVMGGRNTTPCDLSALGTEGWELVTIYPVGDAMRAPVYYAVFKREVRDG